MKTDKVVASISRWTARLNYRALPGEVIEQAKRLIVDAIGCALGSAGAEPVRIAQALAAESALGGQAISASVLLSGVKTSPELAAFANGSMIRYLDFNDAYSGQGTVHPSDMVAPALALAEAFGLGAQGLILGTVLGYEILCALADSKIMVHPRLGSVWDQATFGVISATALAARLMNLDEEKVGHALGLAICSHLTLGQVRVGEISHWKGCAVANASRNAIFCARLAQKGMTAPADIFEGARGFFAVAGSDSFSPEFSGMEGPWRILQARVKAYPSGYFSQSAIEAALAARQQIGDVGQIESVHLETFGAAVRVMGSGASKWAPQTRESADHSLPYCIAMALLRGEVTVQQYEREEFRDPVVREFMRRIEVTLEEESERAWPKVPLSTLKVKLRNGEYVQSRISFHIGHYERPMTESQQADKFLSMASRCSMPLTQAQALLSTLRNLDRLHTIADMVGLAILH